MEMVVAILASKVVDVLLPYLLKGADEFAKEAGKAAFDKTKNLLETYQEKVVGKQRSDN